MWERIDRELSFIFKLGEESLNNPKQSKRAWSPALAKAGAIKHYWRIRLSKVRAGASNIDALKIKAQEYNIEDNFSEDIPTLEARINEATVQCASIVNRSVVMRDDHDDTLIQNLEGRKDK